MFLANVIESSMNLLEIYPSIRPGDKTVIRRFLKVLIYSMWLTGWFCKTYFK